MENKIKQAMLEIKVSQLADEVARTLLMEEVGYEFIRKQNDISEEVVTKHMTDIYKTVTKLRDHQDLAICYGNGEVVNQCWVLIQPLYDLMHKYRGLIM